MADRFRSLPPGGMAPSRANVGSRQEGRRRGEIASSDVGDEAVFQAAPEVSQRLPRGRRPDPRDEREEARRFASVNLPSQRVREMADMTTTDDDATLDRRRRREEKFQGPVRTRAPPGAHNYESRPRVLHHDSDEDDRRGRYTSENSARRRANDDRRAYASTGAPMRGSDRRDDERDALRGPSSVTWNSSTPLRPRTRQTDGAPSTRGTRDAPSGNRRTRDSSSERPARADSDAPFRGVDSQLYGRKPEGRRAPAPSGRSPRGSRRKASPPRNWRDEEGSLPSSDESSSGSEQVRMSPVRRRPNGNPSRSPSPSSSTDGSVVSSSSSGTGRHDSDSDSDNTNDRRRAGNNLGGGEMTATAAGRRRRRLPGDLVADVEPARSRRERSDEDTDGSGKETQKEKKDPDSALTAGGAGSAEREQSADHEGSDSSSSEEGGRRRASNAPIFIENARTGKFSRLGYKDAQKEQRRRNQRAQADDQPRTVEQSVAALVSGLHILVFFISGLIAGMALLNAILTFAVLGMVEFLRYYSFIAIPMHHIYLFGVTATLAVTIDRGAKAHNSGLHNFQPISRILDITIGAAYLIAFACTLALSAADERWAYMNNRIPYWYLQSDLVESAAAQSLFIFWHVMNGFRLACILLGWTALFWRQVILPETMKGDALDVLMEVDESFKEEQQNSQNTEGKAGGKEPADGVVVHGEEKPPPEKNKPADPPKKRRAVALV